MKETHIEPPGIFCILIASCKWKYGCVACSYEHAMKYVLRHGKPPGWWHTSTRSVLSGMFR